MHTINEGEGEFWGYLMYSDLMRVYHEEVIRLEGHD